ncbi:MAG TPA: hypothetical protein PKA13_25360 [Geminicoccaceae bacterium]|nr:hypothetical protein [Geminicoccus sp.]HMU53126.1 hypothetical protein [Geminicoccaceae bacterium]
MTEIALPRFTQVGLNEKVGFSGPDKTDLATRPAEKGFFGRVVGWFRNQSSAHLAEKREVMGAFLGAMRKEYGVGVADLAFRHGVGGISSHSLRGTQIQAARARAEILAVDHFLVCLNGIHRGAPLGASFTGIMADLGIDAGRLDQGERTRLAEAVSARIAAKATPGQRLSWAEVKAEARMAIQNTPRFRAASEVSHALTSASQFVPGSDPVPLQRAFDDYVDSPAFKALPHDTRDAIMTKIADKMAYKDVETGMALRLADPAEFRHTLDLIAFEAMSPAQVTAKLRGMSERDLLALLDHAFSDKSPYGQYREGGWAMTTALKQMISAHGLGAPAFDRLAVADKAVLRSLIQGLESGRFDPGLLRELRASEADLSGVLFGLRADAEEHSARFAGEFAARTAQVVGKLDARLAELGVAGRQDEPLARELLALRGELAGLQAAMPDGEAFARFNQVFGFRFEDTPAFSDLTAHHDDPDIGLRRLGEAFAQVGAQLRASGNPDTRAETAALGRMVIALPTAEKSLDSMSYLPSLVEDLSGTLQRLGARDGEEHSLRDHPILVFDQSGPAKLAANRDYIAGLNARTGANIVQVSMAEVNALSDKLGLRELFATSQDGRAGFGGARNMSFLLAPMLHKAMRDPEAGVHNMTELAAKPRAYLEGLMRDVLSGTGHEMVLMGDDDTTVRPGFMDAKMQLAARYEDDYAKITTLTLGRATTKIPPVLHPSALKAIAFDEDAMITGLDQINDSVTGAMRATQWEGDPSKAVEHQMAGALMHPGSCLDLPLPSEEGQFANYKHEVVDWLGSALHHPGDRFKPVDERLGQLGGYYNQAQIAIDLLGVIDKPHSDVLPWNDRRLAFDDIGGIYEHAASAEVQRGIRTAFMARLVDMPVNQELLDADQAFQTLEARDRQRLDADPLAAQKTAQVKSAFLGASASYATAVAYRDKLVEHLLAAFRLTPPSPEKAAIEQRLADDPDDKAAKKDALQHLVAHGGPGLDVMLRVCVNDAATATPGFAGSDIAKSMQVVATSTLFRFGELSHRLAEIYNG